jgi:predicted phage-related endonuclease
MNTLSLPPIDLRQIEIIQNRETWLASRGKDHRIGGSDVARILGRSDHGGPWSLWSERMRNQGGAATVRQDTAEMKRGRDFEATVLNIYGQDYGCAVYLPRAVFASRLPSAEVVVHHEKEAWAVATPDAFSRDVQRGEWGGGEAKTSAIADDWGPSCEIRRWESGCENLLPVAYALQMYWYLECTGLPWWDLCAMIISYGLEFRRYRIYRDAEVQGRLLEAIGAWRERHLVQCQPPSITSESECRNWLGLRFPKSKETRPPTPQERAMATEYIALKRQIREAKERVAELECRLLDSMGEVGGLILEEGGRGVRPSVLRRVVVGEYTMRERLEPARTVQAKAYLKAPSERSERGQDE